MDTQAWIHTQTLWKGWPWQSGWPEGFEAEYVKVEAKLLLLGWNDSRATQTHADIHICTNTHLLWLVYKSMGASLTRADTNMPSLGNTRPQLDLEELQAERGGCKMRFCNTSTEKSWSKDGAFLSGLWKKMSHVCLHMFIDIYNAGWAASCMYFLDLCYHVSELVNKTELHFQDWCGVGGPMLSAMHSGLVRL